MDVILKETNETKKGQKTALHRFIRYKNKLTLKSNVTVIINQPCIEIWLLLHFEYTGAPFANCASATRRLLNHMEDYSKSQKYYTREGDDIYIKLEEFLPIAIPNSQKFRTFHMNNPDRAYLGMHKLSEILGLV